MESESRDLVRISPWYLNTRQISAATGYPISAVAQTSIVNNSSERADAMGQAMALAQRMMLSGKIPSLTERLIAQTHPDERVFASLWESFNFRGLSPAFLAEQAGKVPGKAICFGSLTVGRRSLQIEGELKLEHVSSMTGVTEMSRKKRVYLAGHFEFRRKSNKVRVSPVIIGEMYADYSQGMSLAGRWPLRARVFPDELDCFKAMKHVKGPTQAQFEKLRKISEQDIKQAFAQIIGETFVQHDWGGERSDLYTSRMVLWGRPLAAAFLFKGPAVYRPMHPNNLGKRGDQLVRLFSEPADLMVLQHCHEVKSTVIETMDALAVRPLNPRLYCVIDGGNTYRILKAYGCL